MGSDRHSDSAYDRQVESQNDRLAHLLWQYVNRLNSGEELSAGEIQEAHPDSAEELLRKLKIFQQIDTKANLGAPLGTLGDYTLRRQIGRGGMGVVYDAWQGSLDRQVALKVLPAGIAVDNKAFMRFMREAKTAAQLNHPNVVGVHSVGLEKDTPYYAMDYVEGETLAQVIAKIKGAEDEAETPFGKRTEQQYYLNIAKVFAGVAEGLQHAHSKGVIHRDIKPSNLILDQEGRLRILDFGLARLEGQESITASGDFVGTPLYMSPEQARQKKIQVDHRTDVYSLGATMYEMLCGRPPFKGRNHQDTLSQIIERDPTEPRRLNQRVPKDIETIVLKCLRKDPGDRYGTAEALGQDLRRFVRGDPIEARPLSTWEWLGRRLRRSRKVVVPVASVFSATIAGLVVSAALIMQAWSSAETQRKKAVDERDARSRDLYVSDMRLAQQDWISGNHKRFLQLLDRHRPASGQEDLRRWEWRHLDALRHTAILKLGTQAPMAYSVDWQPDGSMVAGGNLAGTVRVWDSLSGRLLWDVQTGSGSVGCLRWNPDGRRFAVLNPNGTLRVYDVIDHREVFVEPMQSEWISQPIWCSLEWSPDGRLLASCVRENPIRIREAENWEVQQSLIPHGGGFVSSLAWSHDGNYLAAAVRSGQILVWPRANWDEPERIPVHGGWLYDIAWGPEDRLLAAASADHKVRIWDVHTLELEAVLSGHNGQVYSLAWNNGQSALASAGQDGFVKIWDTAIMSEVKTLRGHQGKIWSVAWNSSGTLLATGCSDGAVRIWDPTVDPTATRIGGTAPVTWSPEGKWIAARGENRTSVVIYSADGSAELVQHLEICNEGNVTSMSFSPDGGLLAVGSKAPDSHAGGVIAIWRWQDRVRLRLLRGHTGNVTSLAWNPCGQRRLASGSLDHTIRIWDTTTWEETGLLTAHEERVGAVAWSPTGELLATTSYDLHLKLWDTRSWQVRYDLRRAELLQLREITLPNAIAWSPDGRHLASVCASDASWGLTVWDTRRGTRVMREQGNPSGIRSVSWSPDGARLATGGNDRTVTVWSWEGNRVQELITLRGHEWVVNFVAWDPQGRFLLSNDSRSGSRLWLASKP